MRTALVVVLGCLLAACSSAPERALSAPTTALLARLNEEPGRLPAPIEPHQPAVMLLIGIDDAGRARLDGAPILVTAGDLRLPRSMARRRTQAPRFWAVVREPDAGESRYWTPVDQASLIRANVRDPESELHHPGLREVPALYSAVRLPFFPRAEIEFVQSGGREAGAYRFGEQPTDPLVQLR